MIEQMINEHIAQDRAQEERRNDKFRCSDAGRCQLMRYWKRQGKPSSDDFDERTLRVFEVGHLFHRWIQGILHDKGVLLQAEMEVEDLHRIGHIDALVRDKDGLLVLYDFKTVNSRKFSYLTTESDLHYHYQAATYAMMLPFGVAAVKLAYISKDDLRIVEVPVDVEGLREEVEEDWHSLAGAWNMQREPVPNPMPWECKYCGYCSACPYASKQEEKPKARKKAASVPTLPLEEVMLQ